MNKLATLAVGFSVVGVLLASQRLIPALAGFGLFALGGVLSVFVLLAVVVALARRRRPSLPGLVGALVGLVFVGSALQGVGWPRINDFTTDLDDPPAFERAATLPANLGRDLAYPADFAPQQRECCSDLRAALVDLDPPAAFDRAVRLAQRMPGWQLTRQDPRSRTAEAVVTTPIFGFKDDVVIRVRLAQTSGSRIDVRSKSRDGQGDLGANAKRIRTFVHMLEDTR